MRPAPNELPPGLIVERVGDRYPDIGLRTGVDALAIGMIAPDEVAPTGRQLIERKRSVEAELPRDLGERIA